MGWKAQAKALRWDPSPSTLVFVRMLSPQVVAKRLTEEHVLKRLYVSHFLRMLSIWLDFSGPRACCFSEPLQPAQGPCPLVILAHLCRERQRLR